MNLKKLLYVIYGLSTYIPGIYSYFSKKTGGTDSARYCYSVWLRHLVMANNNGLNSNPKIVAELGPGDSLGIGLAALISGGEKYFALDLVEHANVERNLKIFDELVTLFRSRVAIPGEGEFPRVKPCLNVYDFPVNILDENRMQYALQESRLKLIRDSIMSFQGSDSLIQYKVPWHDASVLEKGSIDMIYSQAVLEHVDGLRNTYKAMHQWLKPTGYISHEIDFKCHGTDDEWNGHWTYSDFMWKLIRGKKSYLLNREPYSTHIMLLEEEGYRLVNNEKTKLKSNLSNDELSASFKNLSDEDLTTGDAFIQAVKLC